MRHAILAVACLLTACAASEPGGKANTFNEDNAYTPTGSNIPRKKVERDGKTLVMSRDDAAKMVEDARSMGNSLGSGIGK
ncbi:hypothetical protein GJV26_16700 [Massilia dura]|uniref:Lipoprotein n=1 Tax=Pseudoduganella dura TaxID=321982 RepID=A0A6I3XI63_9BURK|nr:hypothetical protein [Pseudoduganella dura]MUI14083.1 hypothetical protein [Pseudoduganella dura]GGX77245.1 hypothetical protein GCM10007386_05610 [Pseudoduganella dura]